MPKLFLHSYKIGGDIPCCLHRCPETWGEVRRKLSSDPLLASMPFDGVVKLVKNAYDDFGSRYIGCILA